MLFRFYSWICKLPLRNHGKSERRGSRDPPGLEVFGVDTLQGWGYDLGVSKRFAQSCGVVAVSVCLLLLGAARPPEGKVRPSQQVRTAPPKHGLTPRSLIGVPAKLLSNVAVLRHDFGAAAMPFVRNGMDSGCGDPSIVKIK